MKKYIRANSYEIGDELTRLRRSGQLSYDWRTVSRRQITLRYDLYHLNLLETH